jgi:cytochrome c-type biogenesis protein CcmH
VTLFWVLAGLFCAAAVGALLWPLWQYKKRGGGWSPIGIAAALAIVPVAFGLYSQVSNWNPAIAARASEGERLVNELAARLEKSPDDVEGWRLLANSYVALGRYEQGRAAYEQLWARTPTPDTELKIAFAEAQILADRSSLAGDAGRLIEEVLAAEPGNPKALWYGGLVALELGREDLVRARWTSLLSLNPPEQVANVVRTQLAAMGGMPTAGAAAAGGEAVSGQGAAAGPTITLDISLGAGRSLEQLGPNAQLFIFARAPEGGPPVAVVRRPAAAVPGKFSLSDANSMIPGRSLGNYQELTLVARLSASGQPTEQPGDWFAQTVFHPSDDDTVALVIDQVVQ